jgi:hypothetical protein
LLQLFAQEIAKFGIACPHQSQIPITSIPIGNNPKKMSHYSIAVTRLMESDTEYIAQLQQRQSRAEEPNNSNQQLQSIESLTAESFWQLAFDPNIPNAEDLPSLRDYFHELHPLQRSECIRKYGQQMFHRQLECCACCGVRDFDLGTQNVLLSNLTLLSVLPSEILKWESNPLLKLASTLTEVTQYNIMKR